MMLKNLIAMLTLFLLLCGCQRADETTSQVKDIPEASAADEQAIKDVFKQSAEKWNLADIEGTLKDFTDDVVQMPPGKPAIIGKEALRSSWEKFLSENTSVWKHEIEYIEISGILAIVRGNTEETITPKKGGEAKTEIGKSIHVLRRGADGSWRFIVEMWNLNDGTK
jgi:uncharacterized protein (TIGR02246 family)